MRIEKLFTGWLFRAYLDLGMVQPKSPHHLYGLEFGIRALLEDKPYPRIQSALNPSFRKLLINLTGLHEYSVYKPSDLEPSLRNSRWSEFCDFCTAYSDLSDTQKVRLIWLLGKLCFHQYLLEIVPDSVVSDVKNCSSSASLAYLRTYAKCRINLDNPNAIYSISEFEYIARYAPPCVAKVDSCYQMVSQNVKQLNNLQAAEYWQNLHLESIHSCKCDVDEFTYLLFMSRYHRVGGFLPQMRRDSVGTIDEMNLAEKFALLLPRHNEIYKVAADEILYPVLESRTKEALWLGDLALAKERAYSTIELSPYDARAWLHLGQVLIKRNEITEALHAYQKAIQFGPPGNEIAWFMVGQCFESLSDLESACNAYIESLNIDPLAISAAERLQDVASRLGNRMIANWAEMVLENLYFTNCNSPKKAVEAYKKLPPPIS